MLNHDMIDKRQGRVLAFFDAVVAIAITVMALEIAIPALSTASPLEMHAFIEHLVGYMISFVALGMLWYIHSIFFSYYEFTGQTYELFLHFILMFIITLFQPTTKGICNNESDPLVHLVYILVFLAINVTNLILLLLVKRANEQYQAEKEEYEALFWEAIEASESPQKARLYKMASKLQHIHNPDAMLEKLSERLSPEYREMLKQYQDDRLKNFQFSLEATILAMAVVTACVICLIFHPLLPVCILIAGIILLAIFRRGCRKKCRHMSI